MFVSIRIFQCENRVRHAQRVGQLSGSTSVWIFVVKRGPAVFRSADIW